MRTRATLLLGGLLCLGVPALLVGLQLSMRGYSEAEREAIEGDFAQLVSWSAAQTPPLVQDGPWGTFLAAVQALPELPMELDSRIDEGSQQIERSELDEPWQRALDQLGALERTPADALPARAYRLLELSRLVSQLSPAEPAASSALHRLAHALRSRGMLFEAVVARAMLQNLGDGPAASGAQVLGMLVREALNFDQLLSEAWGGTPSSAEKTSRLRLRESVTKLFLPCLETPPRPEELRWRVDSLASQSGLPMEMLMFLNSLGTGLEQLGTPIEAQAP